jgi:hypothetical protein
MRRVVVLVSVIASCGGGSKSPSKMSKSIGTSGGELDEPDGSKVVIPAGALSQETTITMEPDNDPPLPPGVVVGTGYKFGPEGLTFAQPVTIELAFDTSKVPADFCTDGIVIDTAISAATLPSQWSEMLTSLDDATHVGALTMHFSRFIPVAPVNPADGGMPDSGGGTPDAQGPRSFVKVVPSTAAATDTPSFVTFDGTSYYVGLTASPHDTMIQSANGTTWSAKIDFLSGNPTIIDGMASNGTTWVALVHGTTGFTDYTSTDGTTFTLQSGFSMATSTAGLINWNGSQFLVTNENGAAFTSPDGSTWTMVTGMPFINAIVWATDRYFAGDLSDLLVYSSTNGTTWTNLTSFPTMQGGFTPLQIAWDGTNVVVGGVNSSGNGALALSANLGTTWSTPPNPVSMIVAYSGLDGCPGQLIATYASKISTDQTIATTPDVSTWTLGGPAGGFGPTAVTCHGSALVAVGTESSMPTFYVEQ